MKKTNLLSGFIIILFFSNCFTNNHVKFETENDSLFIAKNYDKKEYFVEMRDGVKLFTSVYSPKNKSKTYPIMFKRTPYSCMPYGENTKAQTLGSSMKLARDMYIFVYQDVRGRFMSEGTFVDVRPLQSEYNDSTDIDESTDAWDTIDWLIKNIKNNNGKLGMWGNSYPGFYAAMALINAHPAYVASIPQCPVTNWFFEDFHHNGAFFTAHYFNFGQYFGQKRDSLIKEWPKPIFKFDNDNGYDFYLKNATPLYKVNENLYHHKIAFWDTVIKHPNYDDFWRKRNLIPQLKNIRPAVLTVGGWFDAEDLYGPLHIYESIEKTTKNNDNKIIMGPWKHGGFARGDGSILGNIFFGSSPAPSDYYRDSIEFPFFSFYLKNKGNFNFDKAIMFETGNNKWQTFKQWPPKNLKSEKLYFYKAGNLSTQTPENKEFNLFISNPKNPVPYTEALSTGMTKEYMTDDQRFAEKRKDVVTYKTEILEKDKTIAGKIKVCLYVSTNQSAADWVVKLIDVYPDNFKNFAHNPDSIKMGGYEQMVRSDVFRGRYRNSLEKPEPFTPNKITKIEFELQDVLHTFKKGHKIMIQVQSTWFPLVDINPQKYVDNIYKAKEDDFIKATHKIYCSKNNASYIEIKILN